MNDEHARYIAGCATTGAILAWGHWNKWWTPLNRIAAYAFGCIAILIGQGFLLKFNRTWRQLVGIVCVAGAVVSGAYEYDRRENIRARRLAGDSENSA